MNLGRSRILIRGVDFKVPPTPPPQSFSSTLLEGGAPFLRHFLSSLLCSSFRLSLWSGLTRIRKCNLYKFTKRVNSISALTGLLPAESPTANPGPVEKAIHNRNSSRLLSRICTYRQHILHAGSWLPFSFSNNQSLKYSRQLRTSLATKEAPQPTEALFRAPWRPNSI